MKNIFTLIFLCVGLSSFAQPTFQAWQTETIKSLRSGEQKSYDCQFRIYPDDRIEWVQGTFVQSFEITSTEGSLSARGPGSVRYNLVKENRVGKLVIERQGNDEIVLTLDLTDGGKGGAFFTFEISDP